jgi:SAM-dependent methyltransferase
MCVLNREMNYFGSKSAAQRYEIGRPYFHPIVVARIKAKIKDMRVNRALDVGSGTSLSARALDELASQVMETDASFEMISRSASSRRIVALGERLPFCDQSFELITMSQVFHWLDRDMSLKECHRLLNEHGWLVIYDNYFSGEMKENPDFAKWFREDYLELYPSPPRRRISFDVDELKLQGYEYVGNENLEISQNFSVRELVDYLMTHSNVNAQLMTEKETETRVKDWLMKSARRLFGNHARATFVFNSPIWCLRK